MTKAPISLQDLRRRIYVKAKAEATWRFCGDMECERGNERTSTGRGGVGTGCPKNWACSMGIRSDGLKAESAPSAIGRITLGVKRAGKRSAGDPPAPFDEAGAGNGLMVRLVRHSQRKRGATDRPHLPGHRASPRPYFVQSAAAIPYGRSQRPERTMRYRNLVALILPEDRSIPTCSTCGFEILDNETRVQLDAILSASYRHVLRQRVRRAIDTLMLHISQRQLERLLGLSQGYLSRLRAGAGNPSPELVSHLALLAKDPCVRLSELQQYWEEPEACVVSPFAQGLHENKPSG